LIELNSHIAAVAYENDEGEGGWVRVKATDLSLTRLYRGQLMSNEELQTLKDSVGSLISVNSFVSTSINRQLALSFLESSPISDDLQGVLLEIDADPPLNGIKPFANITSFSYFPGEDEVLMMLEFGSSI
jgi:hypothetical protein